ncbi:MAG TPA: hypothetical protein VGG16_01035 [Streptosporangiaceae bacterium]
MADRQAAAAAFRCAATAAARTGCGQPAVPVPAPNQPRRRASASRLSQFRGTVLDDDLTGHSSIRGHWLT